MPARACMCERALYENVNEGTPAGNNIVSSSYSLSLSLGVIIKTPLLAYALRIIIYMFLMILYFVLLI